MAVRQTGLQQLDQERTWFNSTHVMCSMRTCTIANQRMVEGQDLQWRVLHQDPVALPALWRQMEVEGLSA
eukprot:3662855-Amphidinium_carterae.1